MVIFIFHQEKTHADSLINIVIVSLIKEEIQEYRDL